MIDIIGSFFGPMMGYPEEPELGLVPILVPEREYAALKKKYGKEMMGPLKICQIGNNVEPEEAAKFVAMFTNEPMLSGYTLGIGDDEKNDE